MYTIYTSSLFLGVNKERLKAVQQKSHFYFDPVPHRAGSTNTFSLLLFSFLQYSVGGDVFTLMPTRDFFTTEDGIAAPVHGLLVPMAIPLGAPRQQGGVPPPQYVPCTPAAIAKSCMITSTPVTPPAAHANTGLVKFKEIDDDMDAQNKLSSQVG